MLEIITKFLHNKITYNYATRLIENKRYLRRRDKDLWLELLYYIENAKDFVDESFMTMWEGKKTTR